MGKLKMIALGSFLAPIRIVGALTSFTLLSLWCKLCSWNTDMSKPYTPLQKQLLQGGCKIGTRLVLFFYGYVWVDVSYEIEDPIERDKQPIAPIIVVNHFGFAETMYLICSYGCCFVSKDTNRNLPFIGTVAEALQSIFVDRAPSKSSSTETEPVRTTTDLILERAHSKPGTWPPLAVCPEGTTHTGHCLIRFATGAFRCGQPIQPVIVTSPFSSSHGYDTSFTCNNIFLHIVGLMTQPRNTLHVKHLAVYSPNAAEKADPILYANNVRDKMAKEMGVKCYDLSWTEKLQFEPSTKLQELGRKKMMHKYGTVPPTPTFTQDAFGNSLLTGDNQTSKDK